MGAYSAAYSSGYDIGEGGVQTPTPPERVFVVAHQRGLCEGPRVKDPDAVLDYAFDWSGWLSEGESIASHEITASGVTIITSSEAAGLVTLWVEGGAANTIARITNRITTNNDPPRTDERTAAIRIREL